MRLRWKVTASQVLWVGIFVATLSTASTSSAQTFTPIPSKETKLEISADEVRAQGHWVTLSGEEASPGPAVSEIFCSKIQKTCTEHKANFDKKGSGIFELKADTYEYGVERWTAGEVVASQTRGVCHIRRTLKIEFNPPAAMFMDALAEPVKSQQCEPWRRSRIYELQSGISFSFQGSSSGR